MTTPAFRPRQLSLHGSVSAAGFWYEDGSERAVRHDVLRLWREGAEVRALDQGLLVLLRQELRVDASQGRAAPLVRAGKRLSTARLSAAELERLDGSCDLIVVSGGVARVLQLRNLPPVDVAEWLDVERFQLASLLDLGHPEPLAQAIAPAVDTKKAFDARSGRTEKLQEQQRELVAALRQSSEGAGAGAGQGSALPRLRRALLGGLARVVAALGALAPRGAATSTKALATADAPPPTPRWWHKLMSSAWAWLARSRLLAYLHRKQAEYLRDLFEHLAAHDDDEVLRRAIPLGGSGGESTTPALLPPKPRADLRISLGPLRSASSLGLVGSLYEELRRRYEAVFERLDAAGRHQDAAYFLAEILGETERAVAYLERLGSFVLAAQLAESRGLEPELQVRQWLLAGNVERAVLIAVREGVFDSACLRLEKSGKKDEARLLRFMQAERLAEAGRWVRAAELASTLDGGQALALRWLELARAQGEVRGIPLELSLDSGRFEPLAAALVDWLTALPAEDVPTLVELADRFTRHDTRVARPLRREVARELLAHAASDGSAAVAKSARQMAELAGGAFKADLPPVVSFTPGTPLLKRHELAANDGGTRPAHDAVRFGRQLLVALGEAGVALFGASGKLLAHFDLPADALVASADGGRVLAVAARGRGFWQVGRIDVAARRSQRWCELEAASFAPTFDGQTWVVARNAWPNQPSSAGQLLYLDVLDERPRVLRQVPMPLFTPVIELTAQSCSLVGCEPAGPVELLRYAMPGLVLRQRTVVVPLDEHEDEDEDESAKVKLSAAVASRGEAQPLVYEPAPHPRLRIGTETLPLPGQLAGHPTLLANYDYYALTLTTPSQLRLIVGSLRSSPVLDLTLHATTHTHQRLDEDRLLVADSTGRVLTINARTGQLRVALRT